MKEGIKGIYEKAEIRRKSGKDPVSADWQAALEINLFLMHKHLVDNPGKLLPVQIDDQNEWDFYLDIQEKIDLPPDVYAMLITPSASKSMPPVKTEDDEIIEIDRMDRNAYRSNLC